MAPLSFQSVSGPVVSLHWAPAATASAGTIVTVSEPNSTKTARTVQSGLSVFRETLVVFSVRTTGSPEAGMLDQICHSLNAYPGLAEAVRATVVGEGYQ